MLYVVLRPEEHARLVAFARRIGCPVSWAVRDGLRVYLDAVETDAERVARTLARLRAPVVDVRKAGRTEQPPRGRPRASNVR